MDPTSRPWFLLVPSFPTWPLSASVNMEDTGCLQPSPVRGRVGPGTQAHRTAATRAGVLLPESSPSRKLGSQIPSFLYFF